MRVIKTSGIARQTATDYAIKYQPYFDVKTVYFQENSSYAFLNMKRHNMCAPSITTGDDLMIPLTELALIYQGKLNVQEAGSGYVLNWDNTSVTLKAGEPFLPAACSETSNTPAVINDIFYVPAQALLHTVFHKAVLWEQSYLAPGIFMGVANSENELFENDNVIKTMLIQSEKNCGILQRTYYYEAADCLIPYRLYVPSSYNPDKASRLIVYLHGACGSEGEDGDLSFTHGEFEQLAEKYNTLFLAPNGYCHGFYGGWTPELHPEQASEEERRYLHLCEQEPLSAIKEICNLYHVDERNIFLTGNSMGGGGTFYLAMHYPRLFRAIAPCGAVVNTDIFSYNLSDMKNMPMLLVVGTENIDYGRAEQTVKDLKTCGINAVLHTVGGGLHESAWIKALPEIFEFFDRYTIY